MKLFIQKLINSKNYKQFTEYTIHKLPILKLIGLTLLLCSFNLIILPANSLAQIKKPRLRNSIKQLFSHKDHKKVLENLNINCQDCHIFSIKATQKGPLATPINSKYLKPASSICHQCHLGNVTSSRRHQCTLCHIKLEEVKPKDHFAGWKHRHGKISQFDMDSCRKCHKRNECSKCHFNRDHMKQNVHRANFRLTHSIEARAKPHTCIQCHRSTSFCIKCHRGNTQ